MDTNNGHSSANKSRAKKKGFRETLFTDRKFRDYAKRVVWITIGAVLVELVVLRLAQSELANDANTFKAIVIASFLAAMSISSAIVCFIVRIVDEYVCSAVD